MERTWKSISTKSNAISSFINRRRIDDVTPQMPKSFNQFIQVLILLLQEHLKKKTTLEKYLEAAANNLERIQSNWTSAPMFASARKKCAIETRMNAWKASAS